MVPLQPQAMSSLMPDVFQWEREERERRKRQHNLPKTINNGDRNLYVSSPSVVSLGEMTPGKNTSEEDVQKVVSVWQANIKRRSVTDNDIYLFYPLGFHEYCSIISRYDSLKNRVAQGKDIYETPAGKWLVHNFDRETFLPTMNGWLSYLCAKQPDLLAKLQTAKAPELREEARREHTLISGATGCGKSELMKVLAFHYLRHQTAAVVVIDPHDRISREIGRWPFLHGRDRLAFFTSIEGKTAGLNPFQTPYTSNDMADAIAEQIAGALSEVLERNELTSRMHTAVRNCSRFLLDVPGATFNDLRHMMEDEKKYNETQELLKRAQAHPDWEIANYFQRGFSDDRLKVTREGIWDRMNTLLGSSVFRSWFCYQSNFDLASAIERKQAIIFNLGHFAEEGQKVAGKLILSMIVGLGRRRFVTNRNHTPVHVFIDEARYFVGRSLMAILQELRKVNIHLTLAQQVEGTSFSAQERASLFRSTAVKFVNGRAIRELAEHMNIENGSSDNLKRGEFLCQWGHGTEPMLVRVRNDLANLHTQTTDAAWNAEMERQLARYYRTLPPGAPLPAILKAPTLPRPRNREVE